jgi:hypothetical protein
VVLRSAGAVTRQCTVHRSLPALRAVVDDQNALTESVLQQCDTRDQFK